MVCGAHPTFLKALPFMAGLKSAEGGQVVRRRSGDG